MENSNYQAWLLKTEPETRLIKGHDISFSIDDLEKVPVEHWDGIRNHEAKNLMKDKMKIGHLVFIYHSNCKIPGIAGIAEIVKEAYPDFTAFDPTHPYYDPKSTESKPTWYMVDVKFKSRLPNFVPLKLLQNLANGSIKLPNDFSSNDLNLIKDLTLLKRGRLSVQPVSWDAFQLIQKLSLYPFDSFIPSTSNLQKPVSSSNQKRKSTLNESQNYKNKRTRN